MVRLFCPGPLLSFCISTSIAFATVSSSLQAERLQFEFGLNQGEIQSAVGSRLATDALVSENNGTFFPTDSNSYTIYAPSTSGKAKGGEAQLRYYHERGSYSIFFGADYERSKTEVGYNSVSHNASAIITMDGFSINQHRFYKQSWQHAYAGIELPVVTKSLTLAARIGKSEYNVSAVKETFGYQVGSVLSQPFSQITMRSASEDGDKYKLAASGLFLGLELTYKIGERFSLQLDYDKYANMRGNMNDRFGFGTITTIAGTRSYGGLDEMYQSDFSMKVSRTGIGFRYYITEAASFKIGLEKTDRIVSFPGYVNLLTAFMIISSSSLTVDTSLTSSETLSDLLIYSSEEKLSDKKISFSFSYDLQFGSN